MGSQDATTGASSAIKTPLPPPPRPLVLEAEVILQELTAIQHLFPHRPLGEALAQTRACPAAAAKAMEWLALNDRTTVGRLKRAELIQLARSLNRFWKRAVASESDPG